MMNRWAFLVVLVVVVLVLTSFILLTTIDFGDADTTKSYNGKPAVYNAAFGMLIAAFALPIVAFLGYLFSNGMFSFAMCR
jgi:heme/copper-type cytochrome/quinol oxidase subunit 2